MAIPLATTTISVWREPADETRDGWDSGQPNRQQVATGLRAHIGSPSGAIDETGRMVTRFKLDVDPFAFAVGDEIIDESTGEHYSLTWFRRRSAFGLDHVEGRVTLFEGAITQAATS